MSRAGSPANVDGTEDGPEDGRTHGRAHEPAGVSADVIPLAIVIESARAERVAEAAALAARTGLPVLSSDALTDGTAAARHYVVVTRDALELAPAHRGRVRPGRGERAYRDVGARVDLGGIDPRKAAGERSRKQPLGRAIGASCERVVDATAGFGQDARRLASMGCQVIAIEREPVIAALLADGLRRAAEDAATRELIGDRIELREGDALSLLPGIDPPPDAVYLDPMFPPRRKSSALARKSIMLLREVVAQPDDPEALFAAARTASRRVIVKRPPEAPPIAGGVTFEVRTKLARYDVYVRAE